MEGKRVIIDDRHAVRQHKVFATFVVVGLLIIGLVWYLQVRMAVDRGALAEVKSDAKNISDTWSQEWNDAKPVPEIPAAEEGTMVGDTVQKAMQEIEIRKEIGRQAAEAMVTEETIVEPQTQE